MGAKINVDGSVVVIEGGAPYTPASVIATDLRGGVAVMIAALTCKGETEITEINLIERGYDDICGKLRGIGADIKKVVVPETAEMSKAN
jgi:UDP-N-acetylglucosamine 1-carboxyvinyltransferase